MLGSQWGTEKPKCDEDIVSPFLSFGRGDKQCKFLVPFTKLPKHGDRALVKESVDKGGSNVIETSVASFATPVD